MSTHIITRQALLETSWFPDCLWRSLTAWNLLEWCMKILSGISPQSVCVNSSRVYRIRSDCLFKLHPLSHSGALLGSICMAWWGKKIYWEIILKLCKSDSVRWRKHYMCGKTMRKVDGIYFFLFQIQVRPIEKTASELSTAQHRVANSQNGLWMLRSEKMLSSVGMVQRAFVNLQIGIQEWREFKYNIHRRSHLLLSAVDSHREDHDRHRVITLQYQPFT